MRKTTIYLDEELDAQLTEVARRRDRSRAALIRDAIADLIVEDTRPSRRPRPLGSSGHSDTSERVDELLAEGFGA